MHAALVLVCSPCYLCLGEGCRTESEAPATQDISVLKTFHKIMIGTVGSGTVDSIDPFLTVETDGLSPSSLRKFFSDAEANGIGLAVNLVHRMIDLLKRRQSLGILSNYEYFKQSSDASMSLDELQEEFAEVENYCEYRHKDFVIALLETCPPATHSRIMTFCSQTGCPCPFAYRRIDGMGRVEVRMVLSAYEDLLSLPESPLVLNCGTSNTSGKGKTYLASYLFGLSSKQSDDTALECYSPRRPCHNKSIDLAFDGVLDPELDKFVVADAHGFSCEKDAFRSALSILAFGAVLAIIHVTDENFTEQGEPDKDVAYLLETCSNVRHDRQTSVLLVWRDIRPKESNKLKLFRLRINEFCPYLLDRRVAVRQVGIPNLSLDLSGFQHGKAVNSVLIEAVDVCKNSAHEQKALPKMLSAREMRVAFMSKEDLPVPSNDVDGQGISVQEQLDKIGPVVHDLLDQALGEHSDESLFAHLFPASNIDSQEAKLQVEAKRLSGSLGLSNAQSDIARIEDDLHRVRNEIGLCHVSEFVKYFATLCTTVERDGIVIVHEFARQINSWKTPKCGPLIEERSSLQNLLANMTPKLSTIQGEESSVCSKDVEEINKQLVRNCAELDKLDIFIDDVWSELMSMASKKVMGSSGYKISLLERECAVHSELVCSVYKQCVVAGHPMQLLRGRPLYMAPNVLTGILRDIESTDSRPLVVVSVIGMQSSAKSTLMNYLFGCGFVTRAGRCTKGLYASYVRTREVDMLILDSEGLMPVGGSREFDNVMTLMAVACSHIVIINQKGELHRHLRELLEVALYALKCLRVLKIKPNLQFVLRDQADFDFQTLQSQFREMKEMLEEQAKKCELNISELVDLNLDSLHLLPSAFDVQERKGIKLKRPAKVFSDGILEMRRKLLQVYKDKYGHSTAAGSFSTIHTWMVHARTVWTDIREYGGSLVYYENIRQIEQRQQVAVIFQNIVNNMIECRGGYNEKFQGRLKEYLQMSRDCSVREDTQRYLIEQMAALESTACTKLAAVLRDKMTGNEYPVMFQQEFEAKLCRRIAETKKAVLDSWSGYVAGIRRTQMLEEVECQMVQEMENAFRLRGEAISDDELISVFEETWKVKERHVIRDMSARKLTESEIGAHINGQFTDAVSLNRGRGSSSIYEVLKLDLTGIPHGLYLSVNPGWDNYLREKPKQLAHRHGDTVDSADSSSTSHRNETVQRAAGEVAKEFLNFSRRMDAYFAGQWTLNSLLMNELMNLAVSMIATVESNLGRLGYRHLCFDQARFANDVHDWLRQHMFQQYLHKQETEFTEDLKQLNSRKEEVRLRILNRQTGMQADSWGAKSVAMSISKGIAENWLVKKVSAFRSAALTDIKQKIETPEEFTMMAFEKSFVDRQWSDVLSYCQNVMQYLWTLYEERFYGIANGLIEKEISDMKGKISAATKRFDQAVQSWAKAMCKEHLLENSDPLTTRNLVEFCNEQENQPSEAVLDILQFVPLDTKVINPSVFAGSYQTSASPNYLVVERLVETAQKLLDDSKKDLKFIIWDYCEGCSNVCPLCGAKCHLEKRHLPHQKHTCKYHLYPAFHGVKYDGQNKLIFQLCTSRESIEEIKWKDGSDPETEFRGLSEFFAEYFPEWEVPKFVPVSDQELHHVRLRRAWMNTRKDFLRLYKDADDEDDTPKEWRDI